MPTIAPDRPETLIRPGYRGFLGFADMLGFDLQPYMRRIARAAFGETRELVVVVPKGNFKTTLCALLGLELERQRPGGNRGA